jgi:hypothetical protein
VKALERRQESNAKLQDELNKRKKFGTAPSHWVKEER